MKFLILVFTLIFIVTCYADQYVGGYKRKDGTQVQPYYRSSPDNTKDNNFSVKGNVNPYTGKEGYKSRDSFSN